MPVWLIPALKAILPHLGTIVSAAAPVFTKKPVDTAANQATLLQQQITELQTVAATNDAHIKALALQIQQAATALAQAALIADQRHKQMMRIGTAVLVSTALSLCIAIWVLYEFLVP